VQYDVNNNIPDKLAFKANLHVSPNNFNKYIQIAMAEVTYIIGKVMKLKYWRKSHTSGNTAQYVRFIRKNKLRCVVIIAEQPHCQL
jgi:hypothetical protein